MVDQARLARSRPRADPFERRAQRVGVERVEQERDQVAARIGERARVGVDQPDVRTRRAGGAHLLQVLLGGLVERGRYLDADDALERIAHRQEDGPAEPAADVDEGRAADDRLRQTRHQIGEVVERHRLVVGRVRGRLADVLGVEVAQEQQRFRHDIVLGIETSPGKSSAHASILA